MAVNTPLERSLIVPDDPIWRLTVAQYHDMIQAGILTDGDPVELLEGWLITKMTKKPQHTLSTQLARDLLPTMLPAGWFVNVQEPITTADSEPEPDILVVRGSRQDYAERHPSPQDVALVLEVADATLHRDRTLKLRVYANARIPVYWILNLPERQLEVYTDPTGTDDQATYTQRRLYRDSDSVPLLIDTHEIASIPIRALLA